MSPTHSPAPLPTTERVTPRFRDLDLWDSAVALEALWEGQMAAVAALRPALPGLAAAADAAAARLAPGRGRLIYVGAGTSGRQRCHSLYNRANITRQDIGRISVRRTS